MTRTLGNADLSNNAAGSGLFVLGTDEPLLQYSDTEVDLSSILMVVIMQWHLSALRKPYSSGLKFRYGQQTNMSAQIRPKLQ